jgi:hypothetical protein
VLSSVCTMAEIMEEGVSSRLPPSLFPLLLFFFLFLLFSLSPSFLSVAEPITVNREQLPHMEALYFLSPERESIEKLIQDFAVKPQYHLIHLFFTSSSFTFLLFSFLSSPLLSSPLSLSPLLFSSSYFLCYLISSSLPSLLLFSHSSSSEVPNDLFALLQAAPKTTQRVQTLIEVNLDFIGKTTFPSLPSLSFHPILYPLFIFLCSSLTFLHSLLLPFPSFSSLLFPSLLLSSLGHVIPAYETQIFHFDIPTAMTTLFSPIVPESEKQALKSKIADKVRCPSSLLFLFPSFLLSFFPSFLRFFFFFFFAFASVSRLVLSLFLSLLLCFFPFLLPFQDS